MRSVVSRGNRISTGPGRRLTSGVVRFFGALLLAPPLSNLSLSLNLFAQTTATMLQDQPNGGGEHGAERAPVAATRAGVALGPGTERRGQPGSRRTRGERGSARLPVKKQQQHTHTQGETTTGALNTRHETPRPFLPFSDPLLSCPLLPLSVRYGLAHAQVQSRSDSSVTIYSPNPSSHRVA